VGSFLAGDREAAATLERWVRAAARTFRVQLGEEYEDVVQDSLVDSTRLLRGSRFRGESRLRTFVWRSVMNRCIDHLRARRRRHWCDLDGDRVPSREPSPLEAALRRESNDIALKVLAGMSESCRQLWRMLLDGLGYDEMASRLGIQPGTLRVRVLRCRTRAREVRDALLARRTSHDERPPAMGSGAGAGDETAHGSVRE